MLTIPNARADSDLVRERIHRRQGEGDSLSIDLSLNNRIGIDAGGRVLYIHEPGGQRLHHLPKTFGETDVADRHSKLIIRRHRTRRQRHVKIARVGSGEGSGEGFG